jgi:hypothetical protein
MCYKGEFRTGITAEVVFLIETKHGRFLWVFDKSSADQIIIDEQHGNL